MKNFIKNHNPILNFIDEAKFCAKAKFPLVFLLAVPLIYPLFISLTYKNEQVIERNVAIIDLDNSPISRQLILNIDSHQNTRAIKYEAKLDDALHKLITKEFDAVIWLPPDLSQRVKRRELADIQVYASSSNMLTYATSLLGIQIATLQSSSLIAADHAQLLPNTSPRAAKVTLDPIHISEHVLSNPSYSYSSFLVPVLFFLVFQQFTWIAIGFIMGFRREHEIIAQKARKTYWFIDYIAFFLFDLLFIIIGLAFVFGVLSPLFGWPTGNYRLLFPFLAAFLLAQFPLGVCFAEFYRDRYAPFQTLLFLAIPCFMLSGHVWPIQALPPLLQDAAHALAIYPAASAAELILYKKATLAELMPYYKALAELFVYYSLAAIAIIHRYDFLKLFRRVWAKNDGAQNQI
ncbi:MAG: ABC transporter permease [Bradymonadales bacterium]|jgi:ABC-2 type transport system permease protein